MFLQGKWSLGGYYLDGGYINRGWMGSIYDKQNCQKVIRTYAIWWKGCTWATRKANNLWGSGCWIARNCKRKQGHCWGRDFKLIRPPASKFLSSPKPLLNLGVTERECCCSLGARLWPALYFLQILSVYSSASLAVWYITLIVEVKSCPHTFTVVEVAHTWKKKSVPLHHSLPR